MSKEQAAPPRLYLWLLPGHNQATRRRSHSLSRNLSVMASPQDTKHSITMRRGRKRLFSEVGGSSVSAPLEENGELVGDTQTKVEATAEICSVLGELPLQHGTSSARLVPEGEPPTGAKWNFNLDTPGATLTLPPVSADWSILKALPSEAQPSEELAILPEALFRVLENCIKRHRHVVVG